VLFPVRNKSLPQLAWATGTRRFRPQVNSPISCEIGIVLPV
jgi:hypothetical protein